MSISISIPFCADHPTSTTPRHLHHQPGTGLSLSSESEASSRRRRLHSTFGGSSPHENRLKDRLELEKQYSKQIDELLRENKSQKVSITRLTAANTELVKRLERVENEKKDLISEINRLKGPPKLPNELISLILSFLLPSSSSSSSSSSFPTTLLTTSLVSKSFLFPSRNILFHTLTFTDIDDLPLPSESGSSSRTKTGTLLHLLKHPLCTFKSSVRKITLKQNLTPHRIRMMLRLSGNYSPSESKEWLEPILPYMYYIMATDSDTDTVTASSSSTTRCFPHARALELIGIDEQTINSKAWGMFWSFKKKEKKNEFLNQITELDLYQTSPARLFDDASNANDFDRILPNLTRLHFVDPVTCPTLLTGCATTTTGISTTNWKRNKITGQLCSESTTNTNTLPIRIRIRIRIPVHNINHELGSTSIPPKSPFNLDLLSLSLDPDPTQTNPSPRLGIPTQILDILRVCTKPGFRLDLPRKWEVVTVTVRVNDDAQAHAGDIDHWDNTYPNPTTMGINPSSNSSLPFSFSFPPSAPLSLSSLSSSSLNSSFCSTYSRDMNRRQKKPIRKTRWSLTLTKTSTSDSNLASGSNALNANALDIDDLGVGGEEKEEGEEGEEEEEVFWDVEVRVEHV